MVKLPGLAEMLSAGVHFGHQKSRWHPKMKEFLFGTRNGVHIINLERTQEELEKALNYVKGLAAEGKVILFVGTKRQARELLKDAAQKCGMPYLSERWIGGLVTNFEEVKKRLKRYDELKEMLKTGDVEKYTKKEQGQFKKTLAKMDKYLFGLVGLTKMSDALYVADMRTEKTALAEAQRKRVPVVAVSDSNTDPSKVDYAIPANDDALGAIKMMADLVAEAINEGKQAWEAKKAEKIKEAAAAAATAKAEEKPVKERKAVKKEESI
ncbi:30S ribosomal protein S2 [Patescibacteria group bacterium]|nr:MAG: 30S ribosomal protein S2 [Patescibacteria group bacterium]